MSGVFDLPSLLEKIRDDHRYHEFLRVPAMSVGVYVLPAGGIDRQSPHKEDELYYVVRGTGKVRLGGKERSATTGDVIFVEAGVEHRFFDIEEELVLLVFFAPPESS